MPITRGTRILGMMMLFGIIAAVIFGQREWARGATLTAIIAGGFAGDAWHNWRSSKV